MKKLILLSATIGTMFLFSQFVSGPPQENSASSTSSINSSYSYYLAGNTFKNYHLIQETLNGTDITTTKYASCDLDNVYKFSASHAFVETEGPTKCNPSNSDTIRLGTWVLDSIPQGIFLHVYTDFDTLHFKTIQLTNTVAQGTATDTTYGLYRVTFTPF